MSTCNRVEVYAEVDKFHGGVSSICDLLARHSGVPLGELTPTCTCTTRTGPCSTCCAVACGLESMVVGESQILGQVRQALAAARDHATLSRGLGGWARSRCAPPAGARRDRDRPGGRDLVGLGVAVAHGRLAGEPRLPARRPADPARPLTGCGARRRGRLDELAGHHHRGADGRGARRGRQPHRRAGPGSWPRRRVRRHRPQRPRQPIAAADLVVSCTGAAGVVLSADLVTEALARRAGPAGRWSCWTWPCPATWTRPWPELPGT